VAEAIVGREREIASLEAFLDAVPLGPTVLLIEGEPGIGKTTLWTRALEAARERSYLVLASHPVESETKLSFAAMGDLLEGVPEEVLSALPAPQARALDVALLRAEAGRPPDRRAVSLAVLGILRLLAGDRPVLVALDDAQWLDAPSAGAVQFALRRLGGEPVGAIVVLRAGSGQEDLLGLGRTLPPERLRRLRLEAMGPEEIDRLLRARLEGGVSRATLRQVHDLSGGNPFFALEVGLALARSGTRPLPGRPLPVPEDLRELVRDRLRRLPKAAREVAEVAAVLSRPTVQLVEAALGGDGRVAAGLERAVQAGLIELQGDRIRFTHPLFASGVYSESSRERRCGLHTQLAAILTDPEERARHLALGAEGPDADVASALDEAAERALARGAPEAAAELSEMALRLTPGDHPQDGRRRLIDAGMAHFYAGDPTRSASLLGEAVERSPSGVERAHALSLLGRVEGTVESWRLAADLFGQALGEAGDDPVLRASIQQGLTYACLFTGDLATAEVHGRAALDAAAARGTPAALAESLQALGFIEFVRGRGIPHYLMDRALDLEESLDRDGSEEQLWGNIRPAFAYAQMLKYSGRLDAARERFHKLLTASTDRGEESSLPVLHYHLAELECWAGDMQSAERHARDSLEAAVLTGMPFYRAMALYANALVDARRGRVEAAREAAKDGLGLAERTAVATTTVLHLSVLGFLELSLGHPKGAHGHLARAVELTSSMGVGEPGYFRLLPDEIEALVSLGELGAAGALTDDFEKRSGALDRPWGLATSKRCRGLLLAAGGDSEGAIGSLESALALHERLGEPFELGRTLLVLGQVQRRDRRKAAARASLERALEVFDRLGAPLWSERARAELTRIGGRAASPLALTPTEERVADLVAAGRSNREVAESLFMSVNTVEWNLSRIYRKLGIRSRTQLAAALRDRQGSQPGS
jgi:DNA-binding CsgD family transcriptional regulator/Cdc6-like AAA superfamily ATPase